MLLREVQNSALPHIFGGDRRDIEERLVLAGGTPVDDPLLHQAAKHCSDRCIGHALAQPLLDLLRGAAPQLVDQQRDLSLGWSEIEHDLRWTVDPRAIVHDGMHKVTPIGQG